MSVMSVESRPAQIVCNLLLNNLVGVLNSLDLSIKDR